jgi:hypothetical protein
VTSKREKREETETRKYTYTEKLQQKNTTWTSREIFTASLDYMHDTTLNFNIFIHVHRYYILLSISNTTSTEQHSQNAYPN